MNSWLTEVEIINYLNGLDLDIRNENIARWIDQKCTPDVLCIIADCIVEYVKSTGKKEFITKDIWHNSYTIEYVESMFKKASPDEDKAKREYDKFFQQPMELFSYSGILNKTKNGNKNVYRISNYQLLEYISIREKNALTFLNIYIEKVLKDSEMFLYFEKFFNNPNSSTYFHMKDSFVRDMIRYTKITKPTEPKRIFTKVLNPLSFSRNTYGSEHGRLSNTKITIDMLMYNRMNFRDIYSEKPKDMTRREYLELIGYQPDETLIIYQSNKAKKILRSFNDEFFDGVSEIDDSMKAGKATNMHHIFPANEFEDISGYVENLIALTPSQHYQEAHPNNNTQIIDRSFQQICLIAKANMIKYCYQNLSEDNIYSFDLFTDVLSVGLNDEKFKDIDFEHYDLIYQQINYDYLNM